jgi:spore germination protein GerM
MKRIISAFLILFFLFSLSACKSDAENIRNPITYYYQSANTDYTSVNGMIVAELREASGHIDEYGFLIEQYLNGPRSTKCISPFPAGITLEEFELEANKAMLTLSPHITTLSGAELMFACVCLTKTVSELTGVRSVQIATVDGTINGNSSITLTPNSFVIWNNQ